MRKFGFADLQISLVTRCVTLVTYSVLVNDQSGGSFTPSRGIHQGDLIFPYFYLICAKGLSTIIKEAQTTGCITRVKVARRSWPLTHLQWMIVSFVVELPSWNGRKFKIYWSYFRQRLAKVLIKTRLQYFSAQTQVKK